MNIAELLSDKSIKALEKREQIVEAIRSGIITIHEISELDLGDKKIGVILEAMEAVSRTSPELSDASWLTYAEPYISSSSNSLKREASRVVGNIAHLFPDSLDRAINRLLENTNNDGTVVRWGSAYALGRIVLIPQYANSDLFDIVSSLAEEETENGVKKQYLA